MQEYNFFSSQYPLEGDIIYAKLDKITDHGIEGVCIDYPFLQIFLSSGEISKHKMNYAKHFSDTQKYPLLVLSISKCDNLVNVSYMRVTKDEKQKYISIFEECEKVNSFGINYMLPFFELNSTDASEFFLKTIQNHNDNNKSYYSIFYDIDSFFSNVVNDKVTNFISQLKKDLIITNIVASQQFSLIMLEEDAVQKLKIILTKKFKNDNIISSNIEYLGGSKYRLVLELDDQNLVKTMFDAYFENMKQTVEKYNSKINVVDEIKITKTKNYLLENKN
jgi:translation initiation factor 2 alpha subunit (eIF-2alpha)